jgi:hypothetical protein
MQTSLIAIRSHPGGCWTIDHYFAGPDFLDEATRGEADRLTRDD